MKKLAYILTIGAVATLASCASQKDSQAQNGPQQQRGGGQRQGGPQGGPPSYTELLSQMDANKDGKLAKSEVKGPLLNDFSTVDADGDGFLSEEELKNAPKPQRGGNGRQ